MNKISTAQFPSIWNILKCKCPRCREGDMFTGPNPYKLKTTLKMFENCQVCGQVFEIEVGFFYGSSYVSYGLSIMLSALSLTIYWFTVGLSVDDDRVFYWLVGNGLLLILLQPVIMRLARAIWLAIFIPFDRNWKERPAEKPERTNNDQKNNW